MIKICDSCMDIVHYEDVHEDVLAVSKYNGCVCHICKAQCGRLYELKLEHIRNLFAKYNELLDQLDIPKLLDE